MLSNEKWEESLDRGESTAVTAMVLSKAFDSRLPHRLLLAKLRPCGIGENSCLLIEQCYADPQRGAS